MGTLKGEKFPWTDAHEPMMRQWFKDGLSAGDMMIELRRGRDDKKPSRSAVISKLRRLGIWAGGEDANRKAQKARKVKRIESVKKFSTTPPACVAMPVPIVDELEPLILEHGRPGNITDLSSQRCKWPIGDPAARDFAFCCRGVSATGPYCEAHATRARQRRRTPEEQQALKERAEKMRAAKGKRWAA